MTIYVDLICIYALIDPIDKKVKYVGQTKDPSKRYNEHIRTAKYHVTLKEQWIHALLTVGHMPEFKVLELCTSLNKDEREKYYIQKYRKKNKYLFNIMDNK
jgi:predicted GIY-YIG superfamily endonuclease